MPAHPQVRTAFVPAILLCLAAVAQAGTPQPAVFADGFEPVDFVPDGNIYLIPFAVEDGPCPTTTTPGAVRASITVEPGAQVQQCYLLVNESSHTVAGHRVVNTTLGTEVTSNVAVSPYEWRVLEQPDGPQAITERAVHWIEWTTLADGSPYSYAATMGFNVSPALEVYHLLSTDPGSCVAGVAPSQVSGYRRLTVSPGELVQHCIRGRNVGFSLGVQHTLGDHLLQGTLFPDTQPIADVIAPGDVLSVPVTVAAPAVGEHVYQTGWLATSPTSSAVLQESDSATLRVVADPACAGIETATTLDYGLDLGTAYFSLGIRLDYQVGATPARAGAAISLVAHGAITAVAPDSALGARDDTRIALAIPPGIDLARPFNVVATIDGGIPVTAHVDTDARMLVLSTGPISGTPAEVDLEIDAFVTATPPTQLTFTAPRLELDVIQPDGSIVTLAIQPDPGGPPVLQLPICPD